VALAVEVFSRFVPNTSDEKLNRDLWFSAGRASFIFVARKRSIPTIQRYGIERPRTKDAGCGLDDN